VSKGLLNEERRDADVVDGEEDGSPSILLLSMVVVGWWLCGLPMILLLDK
jgi:hypothetical protein